MLPFQSLGRSARHGFDTSTLLPLVILSSSCPMESMRKYEALSRWNERLSIKDKDLSHRVKVFSKSIRLDVSFTNPGGWLSPFSKPEQYVFAFVYKGKIFYLIYSKKITVRAYSKDVVKDACEVIDILYDEMVSPIVKAVIDLRSVSKDSESF